MGHRLSKIVTRTGDAGTTGLGDGSRVSKDSARIEAIGAVDELNSTLGVLLAESLPDAVASCLVDVQHDLFDLGGELSIPVERHTRVRIAGLDGAGDAVEFDAEGFEARVIQHEIDHLDGVLIVDRVEGEERKQALRELRLQA